jgi:hypothetical protein
LAVDGWGSARGNRSVHSNDITVTDIIDLIEADHFFYVETEIMDVLAVWTMNNKRNPRQRYVVRVHTTLKNNPELIDEDTVVASEFNWSVM